MMNQKSLSALLLAGALIRGGQNGQAIELPDGNWPQFRGPNAAGVGEHAHPPVKISPTNEVAWQVEVPWSPSSPSVWGQHIYLTTFAQDQLETLCLERHTGKTLWTGAVKTDKLEVYHNTDGSPAASTPATDGERVVSYFGSFGLVCYNVDGKELWRHPLPLAISGGSYGSGTSPIIHGNLVLLNRDQDQNSSLLAVDLKTGKTAWEAPRPEASGSFGTPIVWRSGGREEVVMPGSLRLKGYDLKTGKERWMFEGTTGFACTTPVVGDGLLFFAGWSPGKADSPWPSWETFLGKYDKNHDGVITMDEFDPAERDYVRGLDVNHDGKISKEDYALVREHAAKAANVLVAVKPDGMGDISATHLAWKFEKGLPYVPSPIFYDGRLYLVRDGGMMSSFDGKTGKPFYAQERLDAIGSYYASPVAADGRIYVASLNGKLSVVEAGGDTPKVLHQAEFGERILATPALSGDYLYLRTQTKLYAFGPAAHH